jgi:hypothetical protein
MTEITATKRPPVGTVREWTIALGILTAGNMSRADAEMKLRAYVPLLQDNFPPAAFTQDSLHHVARQCKWFPSYAEVVEHLGGWWKEHRPPFPALPAPEPPPPRPEPTPEEIAYVQARVAEITAALRVSAIDKATQGRPLPTGPVPPTPRYLPPDVLDRINPLPNGRKRVAPPEPEAEPPT